MTNLTDINASGCAQRGKVLPVKMAIFALTFIGASVPKAYGQDFDPSVDFFWQTDPMTDERSAVLAATAIDAPAHLGDFPKLTFLCTEKSIQLWASVGIQLHLGSLLNVTYLLDDRQPAKADFQWDGRKFDAWLEARSEDLPFWADPNRDRFIHPRSAAWDTIGSFLDSKTQVLEFVGIGRRVTYSLAGGDDKVTRFRNACATLNDGAKRYFAAALARTRLNDEN